MATSFEVLFLGNLPIIDPTEGDQTLDQAAVAAWLGTYGSQATPLSNNAQADFAASPAGFGGGLRPGAYDLDNSAANETFTIDGVTATHDATMLFDATLTYKDGTTANISAVVMQDTNGNAYLMPEVVDNADAAALAEPIASITLNAPIWANGNVGQGFNLTGDRFEQNFVPCFTPGTLIATKAGEVAVEDLRLGDRVVTRDHGFQEVIWVGRKSVSAADLALHPELAPIAIQAGALGDNSPRRNTMVSPNHRMLMIHEQAQLIFAEREVLVAAKHLTYLPGVSQARVPSVEYIHIMFAQHQVVLADGAWSESFQPGEQALDGLGAETRSEILHLFPELAGDTSPRAYPDARLSLKRYEAQLLAQQLVA
ncbi:MAG: Hint domain-containing protein [Roseovarius sp.]